LQMKHSGFGPLTAFRAIERDKVYAFVSRIASLANGGGRLTDGESIESAADAVFAMSANAEMYGLSGSCWQSWIATLLATTETPYALAHENGSYGGSTIDAMALKDAEILQGLYHIPMAALDSVISSRLFSSLQDYMPSDLPSRSYDRDAGKVIASLALSLCNAYDAASFARSISAFYRDKGFGDFALYSAFRWDERSDGLVPVTHVENVRFSDIIGCERQNAVLSENTAAFLEGRPANNVLLYGEGGTGKSSSVKALLNAFRGKGLRMIEVYKDKLGALEAIIERVKGRGFKFIIFMDDLSFEQFETDYKFLKAFIEGGLSERPRNVLIYATSNRRHLMRESWRDREDKDDDMHESETNQEKMSLVDRFGIMLRYSAPDQDAYIEITKKLAEKYGVRFTPEREREAVRWAMKHGGFSGRSARQYVEHAVGIAGLADSAL
jgi:predicted AAA+ superfamily ATPase